jgi:Pirin-related protein
MTYLEALLHAGALMEQVLPADQTGFVYVLVGSVRVGASVLMAGEVGWLDPPRPGASRLRLEAGRESTRLLLVSARPLAEPIVQSGPFVAGCATGIAEYQRSFKEGRFPSLSEIIRQRSGDLLPDATVENCAVSDH